MQASRRPLQEAGIGVDPALIIHAPHTHEGAYCHTTALLDGDTQPPTAIFNVSLIAASGTIRALSQRGMRVPEDVSVVALYDDQFADVLQPSVTTVRMPLQAMGAASVDVLLDLLAGQAPSTGLILPPGDLIARASSGPAKAAR
ncbi:MAG: substrate-binding domain-containing protein [Acetobacteraceae bacterium]